MRKDAYFDTKAIHAGQESDPLTGAVVAPLYLTSTYELSPEKIARQQAGDKEGIYVYGRSGNPTQKDLQVKLATLYNAEACLVVASGMAAISLPILNVARPGDHIITGNTVYSGTFKMFDRICGDLNIEVTWVEEMTEESLKAALKPNTKIIYGETIYNPTMDVGDIKLIAKFAKENGLVSIIDNTFLSPYLFSPLDIGIDVVVDSTTKYVNGHGDLLGGSICGTREFIESIRGSYYSVLGPVPSPFSCWLMLRGLKSLGLRMRAHCENAMEVAKWLEKQPKIKKVIYPGLESHPEHAMAKDLYGDRGYGGMLSFVVDGGMDGALKFMDNMEMAKFAVSLGDLDTLVQHPATMTHAGVPAEERARMGIDDGLIRLSVGCEDVRDIIADLEAAING